MGRFLNPDPKMASGHPDNPQTWNRYAYTDNNPLKFFDQDGLEKLLIIYVDQPIAHSRAPVASGFNYGHAFVGLADTEKPNNQVFRGFYPSNKYAAFASPADTVPGEVRNNAGHDWTLNKSFH